LYDRAEAAIEVFRSSFDAALLEESADVRERLRQAASDLMRVACANHDCARSHERERRIFGPSAELPALAARP
jgi:hypothetical protein